MTKAITQTITVPISRNGNTQTELKGILHVPVNSTSIIIFAHGSGSGISSPRNQIVSRILNESSFATLLIDLLTADEQTSDIRTSGLTPTIPGLVLNRFNIKLLTDRLISITEWCKKNSITNALEIGYFGSSTGAAASLRSASRLSNIKAIVSRSGRTDLVEKALLEQVLIPCLFIVAEKDKTVIKMNKDTMNQLTNVKVKKLQIIEGASHLFEEGNTLEQAANLSVEWLMRIFNLAK